MFFDYFFLKQNDHNTIKKKVILFQKNNILS